MLTISYDPATRAFKSVALNGTPLKNVGHVGLSSNSVAITDTEGNTLFAAEAGGVYDANPSVAKAAQDIADYFVPDEKKAKELAGRDELFDPTPIRRGR